MCKDNTKDSFMSKDDIIHFFSTQNCSSCPFKAECDRVYSLTRSNSTNAFNLCGAVNMSEKTYEILNKW